MTSTDGVGVTVGAFLTGVTDAGVIQLAQQPCATVRTYTDERGNSVMTSGAVGTGSAGAVVDVLAAVVAGPAVDADALVAAVGVVTRAPVLARVGHQLAFIHVISAQLTCELRPTLAVVGINSIHAGSPVLTLVARTVVNVDVAVFTVETWYTRALVARVSFLDAGPSVKAR